MKKAGPQHSILVQQLRLLQLRQLQLSPSGCALWEDADQFSSCWITESPFFNLFDTFSSANSHISNICGMASQQQFISQLLNELQMLHALPSMQVDSALCRIHNNQISNPESWSFRVQKELVLPLVSSSTASSVEMYLHWRWCGCLQGSLSRLSDLAFSNIQLPQRCTLWQSCGERLGTRIRNVVLINSNFLARFWFLNCLLSNTLRDCLLLIYYITI